MGWLNLILTPFIIYGGIVVLWSFGLAVIGQDDLEPAEMTINENGLLVLEGNITFDSPDRFSNLLSANEDVGIVQLESGGGYIGPALKIAELIKERGLETYTSVECDSACTILFISGTARYLDFDGFLGFHLSGIDGLPDEVADGAENGDDNLFRVQGVPQAFIDRVKTVPNDDMWYPTLQELVDANVVTHVYDYNTETTFAAADYCAENDCTALPGIGGSD